MAWRGGSRKRATAGASLELRLKSQDRPSFSGRHLRRRHGRPRPQRHRERRSKKGGVARVVYWGVVLALWALMAAAGIVVWVGLHLPPLQSLEIPKRPPSVLIVGDNGTRIATRGDMGGAAVTLREL